MSSRERVLQARRRGLSVAEIARELDLSAPTVCYHLRRSGEISASKFCRRYDWVEVQRFYDEGHTIAQCVARFGFSRQTWHAAVGRGALVTRPQGMSLAELCAADTPRSRKHVKARLFRLGLKEDRCEGPGCGLTEWLGKPISLALHHVNGVGDDNRLENLQLLCPNCHSQTENFAGRNRSRTPAAQG